MTRPPVIETIAEMRESFAPGSVVLVPTMGALHAGHLALVDRARDLADARGGRVVVSIFVNPLQFGPTEDLARYPRDLDADLDLLSTHGVVDAVFHPDALELYPEGRPRVTVSAGELGRVFEGRARPGHFDGMLTVAAKLLGIAGPSHALFGEKDAQQLVLVRRMVRDLDIASRIVDVPTVRDRDGLALSSRNAYLDAGQRAAASAIPRALEAAESAADRGADASLAAAQSVLMDGRGVELDYLALVDPVTFDTVPDDLHGPARLLVAARVGATRLIDTALLRVG